MSITLGRILVKFGNAFVENLDFVAIQTILTLVTIWNVGGLCGQLIIIKGKSKYLIGGLATLTLWIGLFIGTTFTATVIHSIKYAAHGTESVVLNWIIYVLVPLLILGLIHALIMGFPLGNEIKKSGEKLNALQHKQ